jgi:hypothetical protein
MSTNYTVKIPTALRNEIPGFKELEDAFVPSLTGKHEFEDKLKEMKLVDMNPSGTGSNMLLLTYRYWIINFEKNAFVCSSKSYDQDVLTTREFLHKFRGKIGSIKFGL